MDEITICKAGEITLVVQNTFECELEECAETAEHVSEIDGSRICAICKEIEDDHLD